MEYAWNGDAAGFAGWGEGVGGEFFQNLAPISCNLRYSEIIFVTDLKSYFLTGMPDFRGSAEFRFFLIPRGHFCDSSRSNEKIFCPLGWGGGGLDFLRNFELKMENHVNFWWNVLCF